MNPLSRIVKTPSELVLDLLKDVKSGLKFNENQLVEARVLRLLPQGKAQLQIQNQVVDVKSQIPLTPNETLYLKVTRSGDSQVLKMVEAHKPVTPPSPGLAEVRALGREGPYEALAKVLNDPAGEKTVDPKSAMLQAIRVKAQAEATGQALPRPDLPSPAGESPREAPSLPSLRSAPNTPDQTALASFIKQNPLPLAFKLALVITRAPGQMSDIPGKVIQGLTESLDSALSAKQSPELATSPDKAPLPAPDKRAAWEALAQKTRSFMNRLDPADKVLAEQFIQNRFMTPKDKMAALLASPAPASGREPVPVDIKNSLVKAFFPKGIPADVLQNPAIKAQMVPPAQTLPGTEVQVLPRTSVFEGLKSLVSSMALKPETPFDAKTLRHLVKNSGLLWERKLRDVVAARMAGKETVPLKEQLTELMQKDVKALSMHAHESGKHEVEKTLETLKRFVDNVEKLQVLNSNTSEESGRYLLPLPYYTGEKLKFGQLFVDTDRKKNKDDSNEDRIIRVAFMLDMSRLGHVEADVAIFRKSLSGEFIVGRAEVKDILDTALPELSRDLTGMGYSVSKLVCRVEDPEVLATHSLTDRMVSEGDGAVSIVI